GGYQFLNGTSMAAAYVSGSALLVLSSCSLDTAGVKNDLLNNVDPRPSLSGITVTGGRLNADRAIRACSGAGFTISASPGSRIVTPGASASYTATITAQNSFSGSVTLSAAGLPSGASATFNPPSITGSGTSTVTITTTPGVSAGPHTVNIT